MCRQDRHRPLRLLQGPVPVPAAPVESACAPQEAYLAGKPGMDDYLFNLDHFLLLQTEAAEERAAAAAAGNPAPALLDWAPPALPADMVVPDGADVDAWYEAQNTDHLVIDARVRGAPPMGSR